MDGGKILGLQEEIDAKSAVIKTDSYQMSIGELINLYRVSELDLHPEFQRFFRWDSTQKARLIESLLLNIPLPPIFVSQRRDGVWDVVDGLQRLSTIFEFVGILKDSQGQIVEPLSLEGTKYLPSLKGKKWDDPNDPVNSFTPAQRMYIKRARIDAKIILKESDEISKYELFQRLNTGGTSLSDQEVRNCILIMENPEFYKWLRQLSQDNNFKESVVLTDRATEQQYDMELALRFIVLRNMQEEKLKNIGDLNDFLTNEMLELAKSDLDLEEEGKAFRRTFQILNRNIGANSFRRYDYKNKRFVGGFLVSAFEVIALGIGFHHEKYENDEGILDKIKSIWENPKFMISAGSGVRASTRIPKTIELGRGMFK